LIESALYFGEGIKSMRCTFKQVFEWGKVDSKGKLFIRDKEISLVYFRTGYDERQYYDSDGNQDEQKWAAREMLECSKAIKCPSIDGQLITFKTFQ
jgi:hypothetical protein